MTNVAEAMKDGLVAVIRTDTPDEALERGRQAATWASAIEVTWTVPDAQEVCRALADLGHLVGAGTLLTPAHAEAAASAGAQFLVAPINPDFLLPFGREAGLLAVPGGATPSEVFAAVEQGAEMVKVFPAARLGGPAFVTDLLGPFPDLRIMCTGGVTHQTASDYLAAGAHCVGLSRR